MKGVQAASRGASFGYEKRKKRVSRSVTGSKPRQTVCRRELRCPTPTSYEQALESKQTQHLGDNRQSGQIDQQLKRMLRVLYTTADGVKDDLQSS